MSEPNLPTWKWVLAETGIVVAGILIAFSLNSWWETRSATAQEQAHLSALHADFQQNMERLSALAESQDRVADASGELLLVARGRSAPSPDSVDRLISEVFSSDQFDPVMGAYENLVNSGGLSQIRDERLRGLLASFAAMVDSRYAEEFSLALYLDFNRSFMGRLGWADAILQARFGLEGAEPDPEDTEWNHDLLEDPSFQDHLAFRSVAQREVAEMYRSLRAQADRVLERTGQLIR